MLDKSERRLTGRLAKIWTVATAGLFGVGGCLPDNLAADLLTSTVVAVWGDIVFTTLDFVLPTVTP